MECTLQDSPMARVVVEVLHTERAREEVLHERLVREHGGEDARVVFRDELVCLGADEQRAALAEEREARDRTVGRMPLACEAERVAEEGRRVSEEGGAVVARECAPTFFRRGFQSRFSSPKRRANGLGL